MKITTTALIIWLHLIWPVICGEYLISLKTPKALQNVFDFKIGGSTVKELIESKIRRRFSFGKFNAISVDIPPMIASKLKDVPFISDVVTNAKISLFDEFTHIASTLKDDEYQYDFDTEYADDDEEQDEIYSEIGDDDDDNSGDDDSDVWDDFTSQYRAPRHLARISRRTQLPIFEQDDSPSSALQYHYREEHQGKGVYVYVLDSGISHSHPDFEGRTMRGIDTTGEGSGDLIGHGTHVAGLIGSKTYGVAKKANIVEVKVLDSMGRGTVSDIIEGLEYVVNQCVAKKRKCVINMSLGAPGTHTILDRAISAVIDEGVVVVVAGGNSGLNACWYSPAKVRKAITVAALDDRTDLMASFSNWGPCVDIWAPGVNIKSLSNINRNTLVLSGTSMASPIVAGAAAVYLDQGYSPDEIRKLLIKTSTKGIFKKRAIALRPRTPNKVLYTGGNQNDDEFDYAVYPLIDENKFMDQLEGATGHIEPTRDPGINLIIHGRRILAPHLNSLFKKKHHYNV
ncbi:unnamed protein product [Kluyveromyces dobzhanskii CBS 2104]|uniref:WGS project CCBQ000000000 data, contig 00015 n=1 Tax=Kluyveromyces dobzhanskii CBS 2104 TaxID=1427455 RepID=A0A0A8LBJ2_9SACH|nr:unnamed protein product [Kluyveromyces dobzhanskii CBS 2104]